MFHAEPKTVTLMVRYVDAEGKQKRAPAARGKNGRVRPNYAVIDGDQVEVDFRAYELRYYENRQAKYMPAGIRAAEADAKRHRLELESSAQKAAAAVGVTLEVAEDRKTLAKTAKEYIEDAENRGATEAAGHARLVTQEFIAATKRTYVDEVTRDDFYRFYTALRKRGCEERTVANKDARLRSWLSFAGIPTRKKGVPESEQRMPPKPKFEKKLPTVYARDQISSILGAADDYMAVAIQLALKCGLREAEMAHLEWPDVDFDESVIRVRSKPAYGHKIKDCEERDIPMSADLAGVLLEWREKKHRGLLVLATKRGRPNGHLLRQLKALASRSGLDCGSCEPCRELATGKRKATEEGHCEQWQLHKFRRTYGTTLLRNGVDLRTVQHFMGHADLASTMRYLRPAEAGEVRQKLNSINWG